MTTRLMFCLALLEVAACAEHPNGPGVDHRDHALAAHFISASRGRLGYEATAGSGPGLGQIAPVPAYRPARPATATLDTHAARALAPVPVDQHVVVAGLQPYPDPRRAVARPEMGQDVPVRGLLPCPELRRRCLARLTAPQNDDAARRRVVHPRSGAIVRNGPGANP